MKIDAALFRSPPVQQSSPACYNQLPGHISRRISRQTSAPCHNEPNPSPEKRKLTLQRSPHIPNPASNPSVLDYQLATRHRKCFSQLIGSDQQNVCTRGYSRHDLSEPKGNVPKHTPSHG